VIFILLKTIFFTAFPDPNLKKNNNSSGRPCFYAIKDTATNVFWVVPISSKFKKFKEIEKKKIEKFKRCDTIAFAEVLGCERAFLIQDMFPVSPDYIESTYIKDSSPVRISKSDQENITKKAKRVLELHKAGIKMIWPDVAKIYETLVKTTLN